MTPLDVALLLGDTPVARVLQHHGAVESMRCKFFPFFHVSFFHFSILFLEFVFFTRVTSWHSRHWHSRDVIETHATSIALT